MDKNQTMYLYELTDGEYKYYGLTINLERRLRMHKAKNNGCRSKIMNMDKLEIKCIEELVGLSHIECLKKETELIRSNKDDCLNRQVSYLTDDERKEYEREYYIKNKEYIAKRNKKFYYDNWTHCRKRGRQYYYDNKDFLNEKFECPCGGKYTRRHRSDHERTKQHLKYMSECKKGVLVSD